LVNPASCKSESKIFFHVCIIQRKIPLEGSSVTLS
jgi:hypothetical protein